MGRGRINRAVSILILYFYGIITSVAKFVGRNLYTGTSTRFMVDIAFTDTLPRCFNSLPNLAIVTFRVAFCTLWMKLWQETFGGPFTNIMLER